MRVKVAGSAVARVALIALTIFAGAAAAPRSAGGQQIITDSTADSVQRHAVQDSLRTRTRRFRQKMTAGFIASILAHESGHFLAAYAMGYRPHLGISDGKPTVFSGINEYLHKHDQFVFSAAGLTVQELMDELVLDVPHPRGSAFERGILLGGIGTTLFYGTIGRNSPVSDITVMARDSHLSKTQVSLIFGSVSALHALRIGHNGKYAHFFAVPSDGGRLKVGVSLR
jgi:hypothetical protein